MNDSKNNKELTVAIEAATQGGEVLMRYLRDGVQMRDKSGSGGKTYDLVSDADVESEQRIAKVIGDAFPNHALFGEEELDGDLESPHLWIIDPLDGTNNFAHRIPHFAVSIGYYENGIAQVAVVLNPARDELYTATRGGGAFCNGHPLHVDPSGDIANTLIGCGFYYDRGDMMRRTLAAIGEFFEQDIHGIRRFGTAALDLCQVAAGHYGGFFEYKLSLWDFAAGVLIVEEAGGKVTTGRGDRLPMGTTSLVASNALLHETMIHITNKHHPTPTAETKD